MNIVIYQSQKYDFVVERDRIDKWLNDEYDSLDQSKKNVIFLEEKVHEYILNIFTFLKERKLLDLYEHINWKMLCAVLSFNDLKDIWVDILKGKFFSKINNKVEEYDGRVDDLLSWEMEESINDRFYSDFYLLNFTESSFRGKLNKYLRFLYLQINQLYDFYDTYLKNRYVICDEDVKNIPDSVDYIIINNIPGSIINNKNHVNSIIDIKGLCNKVKINKLCILGNNFKLGDLKCKELLINNNDHSSESCKRMNESDPYRSYDSTWYRNCRFHKNFGSSHDELLLFNDIMDTCHDVGGNLKDTKLTIFNVDDFTRSELFFKFIECFASIDIIFDKNYFEECLKYRYSRIDDINCNIICYDSGLNIVNLDEQKFDVDKKDFNLANEVELYSRKINLANEVELYSRKIIGLYNRINSDRLLMPIIEHKLNSIYKKYNFIFDNGKIIKSNNIFAFYGLHRELGSFDDFKFIRGAQGIFRGRYKSIRGNDC